MYQKSFEERVIDRLCESDDYLNQFVDAIRSRANGAVIDLNKVVDALHDDAATAESTPRSREDADADYGDTLCDQEQEECWESA